MSYAGSILDKLLAHATADDANYKTERGIRLVTSLNDEDFPHVFAFAPSDAPGSLPFRQEEIVGTFNIGICTKDETQEQLLVRGDAFRARIKADRTLTGDVDNASVSSRTVSEDPRSSVKTLLIVVTTEDLE